jgi:hypothetical protein
MNIAPEHLNKGKDRTEQGREMKDREGKQIKIDTRAGLGLLNIFV